MSTKSALALVAMALCIAAAIAASPSDSKDSRKRHKWERLGLWGKRSAIAPLAGVEHETQLSPSYRQHQLEAAAGVNEVGSEEMRERVDKRRQGTRNEWSRLGLIGRK